MKNFFSKYNQIRRKLRTWSHLLKKSLMENFTFCYVPRKGWKLREQENSLKTLVQVSANFAATESVLTWENCIPPIYLPLNDVFYIFRRSRPVKLGLYLRTKTWQYCIFFNFLKFWTFSLFSPSNILYISSRRADTLHKKCCFGCAFSITKLQ